MHYYIDHTIHHQGLDPAGPLYEGLDAELKLDATDADFVDVIHTNADRFLVGGLGSYEKSGHADFYPNGGQWQPGCRWVIPGGVHYLYSGTNRKVDFAAKLYIPM